MDKLKALSGFQQCPQSELQELDAANGIFSHFDSEFQVLSESESFEAAKEGVFEHLSTFEFDEDTMHHFLPEVPLSTILALQEMGDSVSLSYLLKDYEAFVKESIEENGLGFFITGENDEEIAGPYTVFRLN